MLWQNYLEQEECTNPWDYPSHNIACHMARLCLIQQSEHIVDRWENHFRKVGGHDLPPICQHDKNSIHQFNRSIATGPRIPGKFYPDNVKWPYKTCEDLATFMFCSSSPNAYEATARQYLDNITSISNYNIQEIIA